MRSSLSVKLLSAVGVVTAVAILSATLIAAKKSPAIMRVDFGVVKTKITPAYDATAPELSDAPIKEFVIPITDETIEISKGVKYIGWTFGGTVPGPILRVRQGDLVRVKVKNASPMPHSIDFHAARIPANEAYRMILPKDSITFEYVARDAGVFMVHCGTPPITMHVMQGMYFAIIVEPRNGWGTKADKEVVLVQSEFYAKEDSSKAAVPDYEAAMAKQATYVVFNGRAFQYKESPIKIKEGERVRFFVMNAGPNFNSDFHIVGAVFDRVYPDGNPRNSLEGVQTYMVPAGGGAVFEAVFEKGQSGTGLYPFVTHSFADAEKGAVGIIQVGTPTKHTSMSH